MIFAILEGHFGVSTVGSPATAANYRTSSGGFRTGDFGAGNQTEVIVAVEVLLLQW